MRSEGNLVYASVVIAVTFKILFDSHNLNILVFFFAIMSICLYFLCVYGMSQF